MLHPHPHGHGSKKTEQLRCLWSMLCYGPSPLLVHRLTTYLPVAMMLAGEVCVCVLDFFWLLSSSSS